jgi:hypothetical protein
LLVLAPFPNVNPHSRGAAVEGLYFYCPRAHRELKARNKAVSSAGVECVRRADSLDCFLDHDRPVWPRDGIHDRCLCHASTVPCERAADGFGLGQYAGCPLQILWTDSASRWRLGVRPFGSKADAGDESNFHRNLNFAGGTGFQYSDQPRVFFQPLLAVWVFPAAFVALAATTPAGARNLAVAFTIPCGYLIGAGAIPTFIGMMGDAGSFARGFIVTGALIVLGGALALLLRLPAKDKAVL